MEQNVYMTNFGLDKVIVFLGYYNRNISKVFSSYFEATYSVVMHFAIFFLSEPNTHSHLDRRYF